MTTAAAAAGSACCSGGLSLLLAVGLSNNSVQAFSIMVLLPPPPSQQQQQQGPCCSVRQVMAAECADRCLLYSLALLLRRQASSESNGARWLVAAGTILQDVLVWQTPVAADGTPAYSTPAAVPLLLRLKGHEGSIHRCAAQPRTAAQQQRTAAAPCLPTGAPALPPSRRVRWSPCGRLLASASDDRSLRLWAIPEPALESGAAAAAVHQPLQAQRVLWGHAARLWDCAFDGGPGSSRFLVTASEDCTCRVWCLATGGLLATVQVRCQLLALQERSAHASCVSCAHMPVLPLHRGTAAAASGTAPCWSRRSLPQCQQRQAVRQQPQQQRQAVQQQHQQQQRQHQHQRQRAAACSQAVPMAASSAGGSLTGCRCPTQQSRPSA